MYPNLNSSIFKNSLNFLKNIDFPAILDGTSKTLGVINQAIPIVYQVKPFVNNAKTIFKIANEINTPTEEQKETSANTSPIFYI